METNPLVSIIVLTYNSSFYVVETLESIKKQIYTNIELIICDDCSNDNTIEICNEWINNNESRFKRISLISSTKNMGIPANCNKGINDAKGVWIKIIAGDDLLVSTCILDNIEYIIKKPEILILQSNTYLIDSKSNIIGESKPINPFFKKATAHLQHQILLRTYVGNTTTLFINKDLFDCVGYYDESIKLIEDTPMWLKLTYNGYKIHFMDKYTTQYRINYNSVSFDNGNTKIINSIYTYNIITAKKYISPHLAGIELFIENYRHWITCKFMNSVFNKNNIYCKIIWRMLSAPFLIAKKISLYNIYKKII